MKKKTDPNVRFDVELFETVQDLRVIMLDEHTADRIAKRALTRVMSYNSIQLNAQESLKLTEASLEQS